MICKTGATHQQVGNEIFQTEARWMFSCVGWDNVSRPVYIIPEARDIPGHVNNATDPAEIELPPTNEASQDEAMLAAIVTAGAKQRSQRTIRLADPPKVATIAG